MSTVLVTGAAGFIGGYVAEEFVRRGWSVLALVHRKRAMRVESHVGSGRVAMLTGDVTDLEELRRVVANALAARGERLAAIAHCAGRASDVGRRAAFRKTNFESVRNLAHLSREWDVRRFVFVSTTDVYGLKDFHGEGEDELPLAAVPSNPYPAFKIAAENLVRAELDPRRFAIVRPAQVWGAGDRTLTPRIVDFLSWSPWIVHFGAWRGTNRWPLAHVRNVALAVCLACTMDEAAGRAINVLDSERTTMDEFYRIVADVFLPGRKFRTVVLPMWTAVAFGRVVSATSNVLNLDRPFLDPSHYAAYAVSRNLDFSNRRFLDLLHAAGESPMTREDGLRELRQAV